MENRRWEIVGPPPISSYVSRFFSPFFKLGSPSGVHGQINFPLLLLSLMTATKAENKKIPFFPSPFWEMSSCLYELPRSSPPPPRRRLTGDVIRFGEKVNKSRLRFCGASSRGVFLPLNAPDLDFSDVTSFPTVALLHILHFRGFCLRETGIL